MSGAQSISTRRAYGVERVCRVWHRARSSVYARRQATPSPAPCRRRGPIGAAPDDVLVAHIRRVLEASPFHGEGYRKAWAKLRFEGIRTSKERVRRLMREHDLQAPQRAGHAHGPKAHDGTITTEAPDVMWGTDMTATVTVAEGAAFVFVAVDHCATECIGLHAAKSGNRFEALEPIRQGEPASGNASGVSAKAWPAGFVSGTTTGRTTWPTISNRRSRSSASKAPRASCGSPILRSTDVKSLQSKTPKSPICHRRPPVAALRSASWPPHAKGESVVATGTELRDDRGTPPGLARVQTDVQQAVRTDAREIRLSQPRPGATRPRWAGRGCVEANTVKPLSKNPGAYSTIQRRPPPGVSSSYPARMRCTRCGFRKFWPQFFRKFWHQADAPPVLEHPFGGDGEGAIPQEGEEDVGDAQTA